MRHTGTIESQRQARRGGGRSTEDGGEIKLVIAPRSGRKCEMAVLG
jgi:hypothetical protein